MCGNVWMNHFKDMSDFGLLDTSDSVHLECIRYCFLLVISKDLNEVCNIWNTHCVRRNNRISFPAGKPEVLFFQPEVYGARDCIIPLVDNRELNDVEREYSQRPPELGVSQEFLTIARAAVGDLNLQYPPRNREEGTELFASIIMYIERLV
ncbi:hypothetical protein DPMN_103863 [Dreissena polymorpha]|uniref:Integrase core domain-containing protein n=1 Tax=Dreissena polymorpha TaxID=45954 RepID=A0A9D4H8N9_DREPO|nr:hypothetical protein DPMN_103863 [Dreissena polymorpha]